MQSGWIKRLPPGVKDVLRKGHRFVFKDLLPPNVYEKIKRAKMILQRNSYNQYLDRYRSAGKKIVHILHIGKTGGSALYYALKNDVDTDRYRIELHGHTYTLRDVPEGDSVVFFLRDPISRFVSGFYSRKRMGRPRLNNPWTSREKKAFGYFDTPNELALALSSDDIHQRRHAYQAMKSVGHVRSHYSQWLADGTYLESRLPNIMFIGFLENMDNDFARLKCLLELPDSCSLPTSEVESHKNPDHFDKHLDEEAISNLREWYADDYLLLEMCRKMREEVGKFG